MSIQHNKQVVADLYGEVYARADYSHLNDLVSPDFVNLDVNGRQHSGRDGIPFIASLLHSAIGDFRCDVEELIGEGDNVVAQVTMSGIHRQEFFGIPPSGEPVAIEIIAIWRLREGRIVGLRALRRMSGKAL